MLAGLNGDVSTYRWGGIFSFEEALPKGMDPRLYGYYATVRGNGGGSDHSLNGQLGNFSDNDWAAMFGGRFAYHVNLKLFEELTVYTDFAYSTGKDLKEEAEPPADWTGTGWGLGVLLKMKGKIAPIVDVGVFSFSGPEYDNQGNLVNHGFVSFKGDEVGGLLLKRYWGVHPSGYVDDDGIDTTPFDANRKSGLFMMHFGVGVEINTKYQVMLDIWMLTDNGSSKVDFKNVAEINNRFRSNAEISAQERLGKSMGQEINLTFEYNPDKLLKFFVVSAIFFPGDFYKNPIEEAASSNGGPKGAKQDADFTGFAFGTEFKY